MSSSSFIVRADNVGKRYDIYDRPSDRLRQFVLPRAQRFFGKEPSRFGREFWALRGVSFEVQRGESIGIIGRNGSGKSTLLQMITGVLTPTEGTVETNGRIAALLELGSGFNPEFSGRENIYLNGALHGLSREEVDRRFDSIAAFADIGAFIEQPVKTYSSGMFVRLAFAVQVQLSPDLLIVDEALAVGDALFQKRCYQRIQSFIDDGGTLIFVSHDQEIVRTLTARSLLLSEGRLRAIGATSEVVLDYRRLLHEAERAAAPLPVADPRKEAVAGAPSAGAASFGDQDIVIDGVHLYLNGEPMDGAVRPGDRLLVRTRYSVVRDITKVAFGLRIRNREGVKVYSGSTLADDLAKAKADPQFRGFWHRQFAAGESVVVDMAFVCHLGEGFYEVQVFACEEALFQPGYQRMLHWKDEAAFFTVAMDRLERWYGGVCDLHLEYSVS